MCEFHELSTHCAVRVHLFKLICNSEKVFCFLFHLPTLSNFNPFKHLLFFPCFSLFQLFPCLPLFGMSIRCSRFPSFLFLFSSVLVLFLLGPCSFYSWSLFSFSLILVLIFLGLCFSPGPCSYFSQSLFLFSLVLVLIFLGTLLLFRSLLFLFSLVLVLIFLGH